MTPLIVLELAKETLRLINNLIEGKPMEQRKAEALIGYNLAWPLLKPLIPDKEAAQAIEKFMSEVKL